MGKTLRFLDFLKNNAVIDGTIDPCQILIEWEAKERQFETELPFLQVNKEITIRRDRESLKEILQQIQIANDPVGESETSAVIVTPYAETLHWLFEQLILKMGWVEDFAGNEFLLQPLEAVKQCPENVDLRDLLNVVLNAARDLLTNTWVDVLAYGTLLPDECNHFYLAKAVFVADDAVGNAELFNEGSYPMLRPGTGKVYGKHYRVPLVEMESLDELEEHPDFFYRQLICLESGKKAWVYFGPEEYARQFPKIPSGCWRDR